MFKNILVLLWLMSGIIPTLNEIIEPFRHGKLDLADRLKSEEFHLVAGGVVVDNWFDYSAENPHGDCGELAVKAYRAIQKQFPDLELGFWWGYDGSIFVPPFGNHAFLIIIDPSTRSNILVDPSLKRVMPFSESGYILDYVEPIESLMHKLGGGKHRHSLARENGAMLGVHDDGTIFYLKSNPRHRYANGDDKLVLVTHTHPEPGFSQISRRVVPISTASEEARRRSPYLELAYQLEEMASGRG